MVPAHCLHGGSISVAFVSCTFNFSSLWSNLGVFAGISSYFGPSFHVSLSVRCLSHDSVEPKFLRSNLYYKSISLRGVAVWQISGRTQGAVWRLPLLPFPFTVSLVFLAAAYFLLLVYFEITPEAPSSDGE